MRPAVEPPGRSPSGLLEAECGRGAILVFPMLTDVSSLARDVPGGSEWVVDAYGCKSDALRSLETLQRLFDRIVEDLRLHPVADPVWRVFPGAGGVSGMLMLSESHLTCHTYPEHGVAAFNLYCCCPRPPWSWEEQLSAALGAQATTTTVIDRGEARSCLQTRSDLPRAHSG